MNKFFTSALVSAFVFVFASYIIGTERWEKAYRAVEVRSNVTDLEITQIYAQHGFKVIHADDFPTTIQFVAAGAEEIFN